MRYEKIKPNLYSADLIYGKIDLKPTHCFSCFFIVEHTDDKEFIKNQAIQLILSGCRNFNFYGAKEPLWHLGFDEAHILLFPNASTEDVALTLGWDTLEEFVEVLCGELSCRSFIPHDYYLLYDDIGIYKKVLTLLESNQSCSF